MGRRIGVINVLCQPETSDALDQRVHEGGDRGNRTDDEKVASGDAARAILRANVEAARDKWSAEGKKFWNELKANAAAKARLPQMRALREKDVRRNLRYLDAKIDDLNSKVTWDSLIGLGLGLGESALVIGGSLRAGRTVLDQGSRDMVVIHPIADTPAEWPLFSIGRDFYLSRIKANQSIRAPLEKQRDYYRSILPSVQADEGKLAAADREWKAKAAEDGPEDARIDLQKARVLIWGRGAAD